MTEVYKIDKTPATGTVSISGAETIWDKLLETITFGLYFNDDQKVTVETTDKLSGIAEIEYYESAKSLTLAEVKALADKDWTAMDGSIEIALEDAKQFVYYIRLSDNAGNVSYLSSDGAQYDITVPAISGLNNGGTYYTTMTVTVTDKNLKSVTVNGTQVTDLSAAITLEGNKDAAYIIVATDMAGNTATVAVTMKKIAEQAADVIDLIPDDVKLGNKDTIEAIRKQLEEIVTTDATPEEKEEIRELIDKCDELLEKIDEISKQTPDSPQTGNARLKYWVPVMLMSGSAIIGLNFFGKKKEDRQKV